MTKILHVPTHIVSGFLGVGKTSAIIDLFRQKPANEKWAVLVNEYGELGMDRHIYHAQMIEVKEIPGGCICCAQGIALQVAVNRLLRQTQPQRLIIESSGIGHPAGVLKTLKGDGFRDSLQLMATICLIDPMHLLNDKYRHNALFRQQIESADILVANKIDLASRAAMQAFDTMVEHFHPAKLLTAKTRHGHLQLAWLQHPHAYTMTRFNFQPTPGEMPDAGYQSHSLCFSPQQRFDLEALHRYLPSLESSRIKGLLNTTSGWILINIVDKQIDITYRQVEEAPPQASIEFIGITLDIAVIEQGLQHCRDQDSSAPSTG